MKILVNLFHPHLDSSRVNHAWAQRLAAQPDITVRDIYALYPEGRIDVEAEQQALLAHDRLVFQHPFYWYSVPPLMKQWLDDVLVYGWAYGPGGDALAGKEWVSAISTGGPADSYQAGGYNGFSMSEFLKPLQQTAHLLKTRFRPTSFTAPSAPATTTCAARLTPCLPTSATRCWIRPSVWPRCRPTWRSGASCWGEGGHATR